ncbi:MAG: hypothetical protein AAB842_01295, partial [Patescibacteria group bacterium]
PMPIVINQPVAKQPVAIQTPDAPTLTYYPASMAEKSFVQINWNWEIADYFNIYRATNSKGHSEGSWEKIIANFPKGAHTAVDYSISKDAEILIYRIVALDKNGVESKPSVVSSVKVNVSSIQTSGN